MGSGRWVGGREGGALRLEGRLRFEGGFGAAAGGGWRAAGQMRCCAARPHSGKRERRSPHKSPSHARAAHAGSLTSAHDDFSIGSGRSTRPQRRAGGQLPATTRRAAAPVPLGFSSDSDDDDEFFDAGEDFQMAAGTENGA
eukprot:COSAG02_NODE_14096_length_1311_cov_0.990099_1_plen_140_part_01